MVARFLLLYFGLLALPCNGKAQLTDFRGDARATGMARTRIMLTGIWSVFDNPAGIAGTSSPEFGLYYENPFGISELGRAAFACVVHTKSGNFGTGFSAFGSGALRQNQTAIAYGKKFGKKLNAGIGMQYLNVIQPAGYNNLFAFIPVFGLQWFPVNSWSMALQVFNPAKQSYYPDGYLDIPAGFALGTSYQLGSEVLLCAETEKLAGEKFRYSGGAEAVLYEILLVRFGISYLCRPEFSFGIGFQNKHWRMDIASVHHPVLGMSTSAGISYAIK